VEDEAMFRLPISRARAAICLPLCMTFAAVAADDPNAANTQYTNAARQPPVVGLQKGFDVNPCQHVQP
jgi:hypothetical protein